MLGYSENPLYDIHTGVITGHLADINLGHSRRRRPNLPPCSCGARPARALRKFEAQSFSRNLNQKVQRRAALRGRLFLFPNSESRLNGPWSFPFVLTARVRVPSCEFYLGQRELELHARPMRHGKRKARYHATCIPHQKLPARNRGDEQPGDSR